MVGMKVGRNDPCPCGSGKKYKHCCVAAAQAGMPMRDRVLIALVGLGLAAGVVALVVNLVGYEAPPQRVWSEEHQHWHEL